MLLEYQPEQLSFIVVQVFRIPCRAAFVVPPGTAVMAPLNSVGLRA